MTIHYKVRYLATVCPHCGEEIMAGYHRFGPTQVECYACRQVSETHLTPWAELTGSKKTLLALSELIAPSWNFPFLSFLGNLLAWYFLSGFLGGFGILFALAFAYFSPWYDTINTLVVIAAILVGFLLVPFRRLVGLIVESNRFSKTGVPPVWRVSRMLRKANSRHLSQA